MPVSKAQFATEVRRVIDVLRELAAEASTIADASPIGRDEAAEFLREACEDCEDAIRSIGETP